MAAPIHTHFAMAAIDLAELFNALVGSEPLPASSGAAFRVELSAPEGPSTAGGKQSLQHIKLQRAGTTLVAGSIDSVQKQAELRSYDYVSQLHAQRYRGAPAPFERAAYETCLGRIKDFANQQGLLIIVKETAPLAPPARTAVPPAMTVAALAIVVAVALLAYLLMMR